MSLREFLERAASTFCMVIRFDESLTEKTTFKIGGIAKYWLEPLNEKGFISFIAELFKHNIPWKILGKGSNILARDEEYPDPVVSISRCCSNIDVVRTSFTSYYRGPFIRKVVVKVGGGLLLKNLISLCLKHGWGGCEFMVGIPATIGGALRMNAGTPDGTVADIAVTIKALDRLGNIYTCRYGDLSPSYRKTSLPKDHIIMKAELELIEKNPGEIYNTIKSKMMKRKKSQPLGFPSAGSIFKNPPLPAPPAGWLIEQCGLKGHRIGDAQISEKHANWIVNLGRAKAKDVMKLINLSRKQVFSRFGIELQEEIEIW